MSDLNLFRTIEDVKPFLFRITDNRGETLDRFTVTFCDGDYLALGTDGLGFSQWGEAIDPAVQEEWVCTGVADDLSLSDMTPAMQSHILARLNEGHRDMMGNPDRFIATDRETAVDHEGTHLSSGQGIFRKGDAFFIRRDDANEDLGPYADFREVYLQTLPEPYSLAGPEYHSTAM